jgi:hypothetical protein
MTENRHSKTKKKVEQNDPAGSKLKSKKPEAIGDVGR